MSASFGFRGNPYTLYPWVCVPVRAPMMAINRGVPQGRRRAQVLLRKVLVVRVRFRRAAFPGSRACPVTLLAVREPAVPSAAAGAVPAASGTSRLLTPLPWV